MLDFENILPSKKSRVAEDEDIFIDIEMKSSYNLLDDLDILKILDAEEQFNKEREESQKYRISGNLDYISFFVNKKTYWDSLDDLFLPPSIKDEKVHNFYDYFDIYIVYPCRLVYTNIDNKYVKKYKKLTKVSDLNLLKSGFQDNIFTDDYFNYNFNIITDLKNIEGTIIENNDDENVNGKFLPITELGIFFEYKNINADLNFNYKNFDSTYQLNNTELSTDTIYGFNDKDVDKNNNTFEYSQKVFLYKTLNISLLDTHNEFFFNRYINNNTTSLVKINDNNIFNDEIQGELIEFNKNEFTFKNIETQEFYFDYKINRPNDGYDQNTLNRLIKLYTSKNIFEQTNLLAKYASLIANDIVLKFKYTPIFNIKIKDFLSDVEFGNPINTDDIPSYAIRYNNNNDYLWRDLLSNGVIEPGSLNGADFIFMNGCHYINNLHKLIVKPNLNDLTTRKILNDFLPNQNVLRFNQPKNNPNDC